MFIQHRTGYATTTHNIVTARRFFAANPDGRIMTGMWTRPEWTAADFKAWFRRCLELKTGGREDDERDSDLRYDARIIRETLRGTRHAGRNILRTQYFRRRYPHINSPADAL